MVWISILVIIIAVVVIYAGIYNSLIKLKNWVSEAWSQIDVQLKRRNDLIPNLVETVKGYATHEKETLAQVVNLRNQMTQIPADDHAAQMQTSDAISSSLKSIFALAESYPNLKADTQFAKLMEELSNTENKISYARQLYNSSVVNFNIKIESFPSNIVAGIHHFTKAELLATPEEEKAVPKVSFK